MAFIVTVNGVSDTRSACGAATLCFSLADMHQHRLATNQIVAVRS